MSIGRFLIFFFALFSVFCVLSFLHPDVSIWLHQAVKGFRDKNGQSVQNAHLLGLFHRICKLLTYRIKPVFVFDGGVPTLKTQTMASRRKRRDAMRMNARETGKKILENYLKQHAVNVALGKEPPALPSSAQPGLVGSSSKQKDDVFMLPEGLEPFCVEDSDESDISADEGANLT
jgi:DNA excision repair protein ERCC-5